MHAVPFLLIGVVVSAIMATICGSGWATLQAKAHNTSALDSYDFTGGFWIMALFAGCVLLFAMVWLTKMDWLSWDGIINGVGWK